MPTAQLKEFLEANEVEYTTINHSPSYTAQEIAASAHISGRDFAKTVIVNVDGNLAMVVEPANEKVDFESLKKLTSANDVKLASEHEFAERFGECELGAMPPFGNLYEMDVFIADSLSHQSNITFSSGSHSELVQMKFEDFNRLVNPKKLTLSE